METQPLQPDSPPSTPLLDIRALRVQFALPRGGVLTAVDGIDLAVQPGEIHGIVGESGSGKTVTAMSVLGLVEGRGVKTGGEILWKGRNLVGLKDREFQSIRGREIAMVFQNAQASLNPALKIGTQLGALLAKHHGLRGPEAKEEAVRLLTSVRLPDPARILETYSYECSGGMAQRVAIALALSCRPKLLILDEPTAALDVTIAAQIVELLRALREEFGLSILLISHDLNIVARLCDRISVLQLGSIVESAPTGVLLEKPVHAYSRALFSLLSQGIPHTRLG